MQKYEAGTLVRCREREWVVLPSQVPEVLLLRPLGGPEYEQIGIYLPASQALQIDEIRSATFAPPDPSLSGDYASARLLRDATRLSFRSGAGPFRSLGRLSVRPRPFQIVPLLMALRLETVRLLIADDVGIGKTVEAGLIARELLDRNEARRLAVVCPPHLCEQWQRELADKFGLEAVVVRSGTIAQLERGLPPGDISVFQHYQTLVISIDFAKSDRHKDSFIQGCPDLVIVDEAHTAARASGGRGGMQQRHELLRKLAADPLRHLLLLTATPHSGVEDAFLSLLELINPAFGQFDLNNLSELQRRNMARQFVQRRRADVQKWLGEDTPFPVREQRDVKYLLSKSSEYRKLFDDIYEFARELVRETGGGMTAWKQRVRYWTALALLRCVMSSPAAAEATLKARIGRLIEPASESSSGEITSVADSDQLMAQYVLDTDDAEAPQDFDPAPVLEEGEPLMGTGEKARLQRFIRRATGLRGDLDPKLVALVPEVAALIKDGYHPIIYCRYIATADYLAAELKRRLAKQWPDLQIVSVTGASAEEEREQRIAELSLSPRRVLVATDCLSEGINLQQAFNAVLHYDLPWNPNRLEQREGRVDRYGQPSPGVRTLLLFGEDNPIDQAVLKVLLRKARNIHQSLGITVPLPVDSESVIETVVRSLFRQEDVMQQQRLPMFEVDRQLSLGSARIEGSGPGTGTGDSVPGMSLDELNTNWDQAVEREKQSRTRFAQHAIRPEEVAQELYETDLVLGDVQTVAAFVRTACERLNAPLTLAVKSESAARSVWRLNLSGLPGEVRERARSSLLKARGKVADEVLISFDTPLLQEVQLITRLHPLTEALAEYLLAGALQTSPAPAPVSGSSPLTPPASRCGVVRTGAVSRRTTLLLLRLRLLIEAPGKVVPLLAEELLVAAFEGRPDSSNLAWLADDTALQLLENAQPAENLAPDDIKERLTETLGWLAQLQPDLDRLAESRAAALLESHRRVRQVTHTGRVTVRPQLPLDVLGVYIYLPVPRGALS